MVSNQAGKQSSRVAPRVPPDPMPTPMPPPGRPAKPAMPILAAEPMARPDSQRLVSEPLAHPWSHPETPRVNQAHSAPPKPHFGTRFPTTDPSEAEILRRNEEIPE